MRKLASAGGVTLADAASASAGRAGGGSDGQRRRDPGGPRGSGRQLTGRDQSPPSLGGAGARRRGDSSDGFASGVPAARNTGGGSGLRSAAAVGRAAGACSADAVLLCRGRGDGAIVVLGWLTGDGSAPQGDALAFNPTLDPGTPISGVAPDFTLSDQFGRPVSLRSYRGKVVLLAFNDSECTTVCPLTTTAMLDAKAMLGQRRVARAAARDRRQPGRDLARGRVVLLRAARDAARLAFPDRLAGRSCRRVWKRVRGRGGDRARADHATPRRCS